jgi:hypothetical protein
VRHTPCLDFVLETPSNPALFLQNRHENERALDSEGPCRRDFVHMKGAVPVMMGANYVTCFMF